MYRITIIKLEPNPNYRKEQTAINNFYHTGLGTEKEFTEVKSLETTLTEDEFKTIKKSCLEII